MHSISSTDYALQFPFSQDVSTHIDALIQKNISKINEDAQILQNNATTSGITTGMAYCCGLQLVCQHPFLVFLSFTIPLFHLCTTILQWNLS